MDRAIIQVQGLVKVFAGKVPVRALDGLDLTVERGGVYGLLGPNGAGKTTLIRVLATLLEPDRGRVHVAGIDACRHPAQVRARIGLAGQYAAVDDHLTGRENVEMVGRLYGLPRRQARRRAGEVLERIGLTQAADRQVRTYSGGMRRRLDLAASLVGRPPGAVPGRADRRAGSGQPPRVVGPGRRSGRGRYHGPAYDPVLGGGRSAR